MADEPTKEQRFACGCHIVDGELVAECTQVAPRGEIPAEHHGPVAKPFSAKCSRTAVQTPEPGPEAPEPTPSEEKFDDSPAEDEETRAEEAADEVDDAVAEAAVTEAEAKPTKNAVHTMDAPQQAKPHRKKKA
jgi:hypothetical protein